MKKHPEPTALFVYGTMKDRSVQKRIMGRIPESLPDILLHHKLSQVKIDGQTYPAAVAGRGSRIDGIVLFITAEELSMVDEYETGVYVRTVGRLKSGNRAWVYVKN